MGPDKEIIYWQEGSERDWKTVESLMSLGREFTWALFIMHLSMEKLLKAAVVKRTRARPPFTHNLLRLAELAGMTLTAEQKAVLDAANAFHVEARYPDEKLDFYKRATAKFANEWFATIGDLRRWIKSTT